MAKCKYAGCKWYGTKAGLPIHMARAHGIHPVHEDLDPIDEFVREVEERWGMSR